MNLSWDKEDVDVSWPWYDVKARRRCRVCKAAIKRIKCAFKKNIGWPAQVRLFKSYMGLPPRRDSDWFTCPSYYIFDEFRKAVEAESQETLTKFYLDQLKKHKEEAMRLIQDLGGVKRAIKDLGDKGLGDGDVRTEEPARGKKRPVLDGDVAPEAPLKKMRPVGTIIIDLTI